MKKRLIRNKKVRYGGLAVMLTVMVIAVAVLANANVDSMAQRYGWYTSMLPTEAFDVSENGYALLRESFDAAAKTNGKQPPVRIIFCDEEANVSDTSAYNYYLYHTVKDLSERFDNITVEYVDIYTNPSQRLKDFTVSENPLTGETIETPLYSTSVIVTNDADYHRVYGWQEFYVYEDEDAESPWAYNGERTMVSAVLRAVENNERLACFLVNHGETFYDYELVGLLDDAGYTVTTLDLYQEEIPDACRLLISYNPKTDLVSDELSEKSEVDILESFLEKDGTSFYVFLGNATPSLPNFEGFLEGWGVSTEVSVQNGVSYRYMIQDPSQTLSSDGYTIYGQAMRETNGAFVSDADYVVFSGATSLRISAQNYLNNGNGTYSSTDGMRTVYPMYQSSEKAVVWANGIAVDGGALMLMSLTEQTSATGSSYVGVIASAKFATADYLQSAVYGNTDVVFRLLGKTGDVLTPEGLNIVPFASREISILTTSQMLTWTLCLTLIPTGIVAIVAVVVLVKRRRA